MPNSSHLVCSILRVGDGIMPHYLKIKYFSYLFYKRNPVFLYKKKKKKAKIEKKKKEKKEEESE
jgi:hypothetical protein